MIFYDRQGREISEVEWYALRFGELDQDNPLGAYWRVASDHVEPEDTDRRHHVSTVWLGMAPGWLFETMVFCQGHTCEADDRCWRWRSESEALSGHASVVAAVLDLFTAAGGCRRSDAGFR